MKLNNALQNLSCLFGGFVLSLLFIWLVDVNWERRFNLYSIRNELRKEMSRTEVEAVLKKHQAPFVIRNDREQDIFLRVHTSIAADSVYLTIHFEEDKLKSAMFSGEDSPSDFPADAPPHLE